MTPLGQALQTYLDDIPVMGDSVAFFDQYCAHLEHQGVDAQELISFVFDLFPIHADRAAAYMNGFRLGLTYRELNP